MTMTKTKTKTKTGKISYKNSPSNYFFSTLNITYCLFTRAADVKLRAMTAKRKRGK